MHVPRGKNTKRIFRQKITKEAHVNIFKWGKREGERESKKGWATCAVKRKGVFFYFIRWFSMVLSGLIIAYLYNKEEMKIEKLKN